MGLFSARLFAWLQDTDFYRDLHRTAVDLLPHGAGRSWLDAGCGPGLVTRLAATAGYHATGIDADHHMIRMARNIARRAGSPAHFAQRRLEALDASLAPADVVSACSLLAVIDDVPRAVSVLLQATRPGGKLLIVEPLPGMTVARANSLIRTGAIGGKGVNGLRLWAYFRQGKIRDLSVALMSADARRVQFIPLIDGMVGAWVISK